MCKGIWRFVALTLPTHGVLSAVKRLEGNPEAKMMLKYHISFHQQGFSDDQITTLIEEQKTKLEDI